MEQSRVFHGIFSIFSVWQHSIDHYFECVLLPRNSSFLVSQTPNQVKFATRFPAIHAFRYIYTGQPHLATVHFGMASLSLCIFSLGLSVGVVIAVGMLLYFQVCFLSPPQWYPPKTIFILTRRFQARAIIRNRTGIEDWILEKAKYRREGTDEEFVFPYDLGVIENIQQVANVSCAPIGDGITWKVQDCCDQYTLTVEQIAQKAEKRARTRTYAIQKRATGSWLPLWSQGFAVCISPPCTDEPRIRLDVGDIVKVTRWKK